MECFAKKGARGFGRVVHPRRETVPSVRIGDRLSRAFFDGTLYHGTITPAESPACTENPPAPIFAGMVRFMIRTMFIALAAFASVAFGGRVSLGEDAKQREFFESRIRPMLVKHCYECHSAKAKEIKGNLRVDSAAGLLDGGDSGPALVAGKPGESLLMEALRYESFEMPPAGRLPKKIIDDFEQWIKTGAYDPRTETPPSEPKAAPRTIDIEAGREFWAFQPVKRAETPAVSDKDWPLNDIDIFVLAKLEQARLKPAADADRRTLIRRLYFDLIGLPPSPAETRAFLQDDSPGAWKRVVDRLLDSREFGVNWGRHWLDVARYADSNGGDFNATFHNAWKYRDYVIESFNRDKPFDQFVREQIAGDLLPSESDAERAKQIVATGFLMMGAKMLSERDKVKLTMDVVDEQINTIGQGFMGMTIGCARCHDHKFDPIPTADYYAMAGIFQSTETLKGESQQYVSTWPRRTLPTSPEHLAAVEQFEAKQKKLKSAIAQAKKQQTNLEKALAKLKAGERSLTADDANAKKTGQWKESTFTPSYIGTGYVHDDQSEKGEKWIEYTIQIPRAATYDVRLSYTPGTNRAANVPVSIKHADAEVKVILNEKKKPPIDGLFASVGKFPFSEKQPAVITIATRGTEGYVIADAVRLVELDKTGKPLQEEIAADNPELKKAQTALEETKKKQTRLEAEQKTLEKNAPPPLPKAIAVTEAPQIADCAICIRGDHQNRGPVAPRGVLQVATWGELPAFSPGQSGRKELADWIADAKNPLTARVYVNRIWHHLFGQGIVPSVDNFGKLGDRPSHPEVLDRLAADFIADGWSTKQTIRRIVLSRAYRMSSQHDAAAWNADPENRLLWRANRRRLPAEAIRDAMLAISGELDLSPGGSPVEGLGTLVTQNTSEQTKFERKVSEHRSAYLPIIRAEIPPILLVFDFADPDLVTGRRSVTNVPAQALLLLNSPFVMEQAEQAAARVQKSAETSDSKVLIDRTYEFVLSRPPTDSETERAEAFLKAAAESKATDGKTSPPSPLAQLIHTLFASTEFRMLN